jgi:aerobic-type carbon monoxide dehydrogenase small subunit (CoxS/CutS family)
MLALEAQGKQIRTAESLVSGEKLDAVPEAFGRYDAQQCGFCTPGFVMAAKALLDANPQPTLDEVHHGLSGNFCRCGTYAGMRKAVLQAANPANTEPEPHGGGKGKGKKKRKEDDHG